MAHHHSPKIVTDGLVFCIDPANIKSFNSGSAPNDVTDLVDTTITGSLTNGTGFLGDNLGVFDFDGTDDYISIDYETAVVPEHINIWCHFGITVDNSALPNSHTALSGFPTTPNGGATSGIVVGYLGSVTGLGPDETISIYEDDNGTTNQGFTFIKDTVDIGWHNLVFNWDGSAWEIWVDGEQKTTYTGAGSMGDAGNTSITGVRIGTNKNQGSWFSSKVASYSIYTKSLTAKEILQNYNALKGRYQ